MSKDCLPNATTNDMSSYKHGKFLASNKSYETRVQCVGSLYNQSCLFENLYYVDNVFMVLKVKGNNLPQYSVRTESFSFESTTPSEREFDSNSDLEKFVRTVINPKKIPFLTVYFEQIWHNNIGHALFDGLYPSYVSLIRFPPRHLQPFRILAGIAECDSCWSEDIYNRFGGLGMIKQSVLNKMSIGNWFVFDELVMGSGTLCQRCIQPNLQLPGGVQLDASRLFRDRMYQQHGFIHPLKRKTYSSEGRTSRDVLLAYVIANSRFTPDDEQQINDAIHQINNYTSSHLNQTDKLEWPLINISYLYYDRIKASTFNFTQINKTSSFYSQSSVYQLKENNFMAQLKLLQNMDIHITGPGTGQMYQTFLSDGSVSINLGCLRPWGSDGTEEAYTSYLEQYVTSGTPYIKGLYYPINERAKGIKQDQLIKLIRRAAKLILEGFPIPVDPQENLATDGKLFVEMCQKDKDFCSYITTRTPDKEFACLDFWVEDLVHEQFQWKVGGYMRYSHNITCHFNRSLVQRLREKYQIKHSSIS